MAEYDASYVRCEQDIMAWLMTQVPVPACQELARRISVGDHRGCGPELDRQWEIPITFRNPDNVTEVHMTRLLIRTLGGELCLDDAGKWVVVPMFRVMDAVQAKLRAVETIASVGVAVRFVDGKRVDDGGLVHILHEGVTLCGYPTGFPKDWPEGKWTRLEEDGDATCLLCIDASVSRWRETRGRP